MPERFSLNDWMLGTRSNDDSGRPGYTMQVSFAGSGATSPQVQGTAAGGTTTAGNPVKVGGVYNTSPPTYTNGQQTEFQTDARGSLFVVPGTAASAAFGSGALADGASNSINRVIGVSYGLVFNGTTWDRMRGDTAGSYVVNAPSSAAAVALTPVVAVGASSLVVKASPGNFYSASVTNNTTAGFLIVYNAAAAPAGGAALTAGLILAAVPVAASGYGSIDMAAIPDRASAGITLLFSTSTTTYTVPGTLPLHLRGRAS